MQPAQQIPPQDLSNLLCDSVETVESNDPGSPSWLFDDSEMQQKALEGYNKILRSLNVKTPINAFAQNRLFAIDLFRTQYGESWMWFLAGALRNIYGHWIINGESPEQIIYLVIERLNDSWFNSAYSFYRGICHAN